MKCPNQVVYVVMSKECKVSIIIVFTEAVFVQRTSAFITAMRENHRVAKEYNIAWFHFGPAVRIANMSCGKVSNCDPHWAVPRLTSDTTSRPNVALTAPWLPDWKNGAQHQKTGSCEPNTDTTYSSTSGRSCMYCLTNSALSISSVKSSMVFCLEMFLTIHESDIIEIDIIDQRNWMHDSAKADIIFVAP